MLDDDDFLEEFEKRPLVQRLVVPVVGILLFAGAGAIAFTLIGNHSPAPRPHNEPHITQVQLPPPPPPPPPKVIPPVRKEVEQTRTREPTPSPKQIAQPKPAPAPPNRVQTSIAGAGPGNLGLGNGGGGDCIGSGCGNGDGPGGGGDDDAYYANLVKGQIISALNRDEKLRYARYSTTCAVRFDPQGHVASAACGNFAGDADARAEVNRVVRSVTASGGSLTSLASKEFSVRIDERAPG